MGVILLTGSAGLVGVPLSWALEARGFVVRRLDPCEENRQDRGEICDHSLIYRKMDNASGIIHLAAVSRVAWGERDPELCWKTNVAGTACLINAALEARWRPWFLFASSREVYGRPKTTPVGEDSPLQPINVYGRSKAEGERLVEDGRIRGLRTAVVRLANVYGRVDDHLDRVVPAFAGAAAKGAPMMINGRNQTFDFTHVDDVVRGLISMIERLEGGAPLVPPIHFATGCGTTLGRLADLANAAGGRRSRVIEGAQRSYDVGHFIGDPTRAAEVLQWRPNIGLEVGVPRLVRDFMKLVQPATRDAALSA